MWCGLRRLRTIGEEGRDMEFLSSDVEVVSVCGSEPVIDCDTLVSALTGAPFPQVLSRSNFSQRSACMFAV